MNIKIDYPEDYIKEETRFGYTITSEMKKVWLVEMDLLCEVDRICKKYGLQYFADSGTLIGAIRDGGYIPWDDDIDIVMMRDDYNAFIEKAQTELKHPYFLQSVITDKNYSTRHIKIRNSDSTGATKSRLVRDINHGIHIDIFPLDYLPESRIRYSVFLFRLKCKAKILRMGLDYKFSEKKTFCNKLISIFSNVFLGIYGKDKYFLKLHEYSARYNKEKTSKISYISYSLGKKKHIWNSDSFEGVEMRPFEFIEIPIPKGYDSRLKIEYGDYMTRKNVTTSHGDCIFEPDIPYSEYLKTYRIK